MALDPEGATRLLSRILWELPSLPAAACRERPGLFDDRHEDETQQQRAGRLDTAVALCKRCLELVVCQELPLPRGWHSVGVQAGRVLVG